MSEVGALNIRITADDSQAQKGLADTRKGVQDTDKSITRSMKTWAKWGAAAAAAAGAVAIALTKAAMTTVDELAKTARSIDSSIEGLQGLQLAATEAGVSQEAAASSAQMLNQRLGEAMRGTGQAAEQLKVLGLSADEVAGMAADERFAVLADRMQEMGYNSAQTADALRNLGIRNREVVLLMQAGGDTIRGATERVRDYGLAIDEVDAAQVESANDAFAFAGDVIENVFMRAAIEVAPILQGIADAFLDSAKEAGGMGNLVGKVMDGILTAVGFVADAFRGWQLIIKGLRTGFFGLATFVSSAMASVLEAINGVLKTVAEGINFLIRQLNRIRKVDLDEIVVGDSAAAARLNEFSDSMRENFDESFEDMRETALRPLPSEALKEFVAESRRTSREAAEASVAAANERNEGIIEANEKLWMHSQEDNKKWLDGLRERFMSEDEIFTEKYENDLERLKEAREQELITEEQYARRLIDLQAEAAHRRNEIAENERRQRVGIMSAMMQNLSTLMNTGSKKMFQIGKAAAIANALIQGKEAVVSSYAAGSRIGGPPVGAAFAATAAVATGAQINQIKSQSFGSGGNPIVYSGGVPAVNTTTGGGTGAVNPRQAVDININGSGSTFTTDQVRELIRQINEQSGDGVNVVFNG